MREDILYMFSLHFAARRIARYYGVDFEYVQNLVLSATPPGQCRHCGDETTMHTYTPICRHCLGRAEHRHERSIRQNMIDRASDIQRRAARKSLPCDITGSYLVEQYNKQFGICVYTNRKMDWGIPGEAPSVDKIVPRLGYTKGNVVFVTRDSNTAKSDLTLTEMREVFPVWFWRLEEHLRTHNGVDINDIPGFAPHMANIGIHQITEDALAAHVSALDLAQPYTVDEVIAAHRHQEGRCAISDNLYQIACPFSRNSVIIRRNSEGEVVLLTTRTMSVMSAISMMTDDNISEISPLYYSRAVKNRVQNVFHNMYWGDDDTLLDELDD